MKANPYRADGHRLYGPDGLLAECPLIPASEGDLVGRMADLLNAAAEAGLKEPHLVGDILECVRCGDIRGAQMKLKQAKGRASHESVL